MLIKLLTICLVIVIIVDLSGFIPTVKRFIASKLTNEQINTADFRLKPFDCSFCMTFWSCLIYIIAVNQFSIFLVLYILCLSLLTEPFGRILLLIKDLLLKLTDTIYDKLV